MFSTTVLLMCFVLPPQSLAGADNRDTKSAVGETIENISLRDYRGKPFELNELNENPIIVVAFLGTECPLSNLYTSRLRELEERYSPQGVAFLAINSNAQDSATEIGFWAKKQQIDWPVLKDVGSKVADQFAAQRTPEVYVLDRDRVVRYGGRIDDQYSVGYQRPKPTATYLIDALEAILHEQPVARSNTESVGCHIGRTRRPDADSPVTYSREIARILQDRCVVCHRDGEIAPFALTSYDEVAGWATMIDEVVREGRMPPWHASDPVGRFANDVRLSPEQKQAIRRWVRAGAPEGDPKDLPEPRQFITGWQIPEPDLVLAVQKQPFQVPASGEVRYQNFVVDPGFTEDKWVRAAECRFGNRAVVHHMIAFIRPPSAGPRSDHAVGSLWLVAAAPGTPPLNLPEGLAKLVPAGSQLIFQVHYTPNGTPQEDQSHLGLVFADAKSVRREVGTWRAANTEFAIPPGESNYEVKATHKFRKDVLLLTTFPHMHLRGKSFRFEAEYPGGDREVLLDVPQYDFGWQNSYEFSSPRRIPAGTRLTCTAIFDNSWDNPNNPDATATVRWGDQTWEEMMAGHFELVLADPRPSQEAASARRTEAFLNRVKQATLTPADELLARLDAALKLDSADGNLREFAIALQDEIPQVDRIDLVAVRAEGIETLLDAHPADIIPHLPGKGFKLRSGNLAMAAHALHNAPVVHNVLADETAADLKFMAREFASSLHIPVKINGGPGTVNFWSEEPNGFPAESVDILRRTAELLAGSALLTGQ
jgi:peroxiredoxin